MIQIQKTQLIRNALSEMPDTQSIDSDGASIIFDQADNKSLIILKNFDTNEKTGKILAGNGIQGVKDLNFTLSSSGTYCVVESGKYVNSSGMNKGSIVITGTDSFVSVACVVLP